MATTDSLNNPRFLNPLALHLQKLCLALKCPSCLGLYSKPLVLPCDHIVCGSCIAILAKKPGCFGLECPECKRGYAEKDLRDAPYMENLVSIYKNLDATFHSHILSPVLSDLERESEPVTNFGEKPSKGLATDFGLRSNVGPQEVSRGHYELSPCSQTRASNDVKPETLDVEARHVIHLSSDSPPSCGINVGLDAYGSDHGTGDTSVVESRNNGLKRSIDDLITNEVDGGSTSLCDGHVLTKKQKQNNSFTEVKDSPKKSTDLSRIRNPKSNTSRCQQLSHPLDSTSSDYFVCGFCQNWKMTEYTGQMLHYLEGKLVEGSDAAHANTIHVHRRCIDWAPQIYYENDLIKNLNKELSRGAKLKCSYCGIKGAALGCYAKTCRRSYHVPCALNVEECRWDAENFLMLCPSHSSLKFPNEKSAKHGGAKKAGPIHINSQETGSWDTSHTTITGAKKWVLCGSALSVDEKCMLVNFATMCGATVVKSWTPNVTHVIAATDTIGACSRTLKVLMAILKGRWILKFEWIKACMETMGPVDEGPYEVCLDNHGCQHGPQAGRIRALTDAPKLFTGLTFLITGGGFMPTYKEDLQDLIIAAGGSILDNEGQSSGCSQVNHHGVLVVYCSESMTQENAFDVQSRLAVAEDVANGMGAKVVPHTWLLDSIASYELQPIGM